MALLKILKYPDPLLQQACEPVSEINTEIRNLVEDMLETMYAGNGVGLAAPQVGVLKRLLVLDVSPQGNQPMEFINPVITWQSGSAVGEEGCLSLPDYREVITRSERVRVSAQNRNGEHFEIEADALLSRCLQHEIDHLDGVLCIDRISRIKRQLFRSWFKKRGSFE
ncbi:MAG: peptide deformylase [Deltaproteobacteria bacterium]|nr:peptide deformylase [Deltaproteobacteria bacterium]